MGARDPDRGGATVGLVFFLTLVTIQPFGIGPDLQLLARVAPAVLWIGALLSTLLALDRLFQADEEDGSLDLFVMSGRQLELIVVVKCLAHWSAAVAPLALVSPLFALMLGLDGAALWALPLTLLVGTPALTFIGAIGAALTVSLRRAGSCSRYWCCRSRSPCWSSACRRPPRSSSGRCASKPR